ncbi:hypothetical protein [Curtobacterium sp. MCSS17_008]|uniref:hypothetical protein n=1 Tax=Curtobacterium sp. MCSS17_008 TaxID=2175647 RepID=UPI0011B794B8|nr:hypothetical protein [Curtobacterium sp. MCSS17_008]
MSYEAGELDGPDAIPQTYCRHAFIADFLAGLEMLSVESLEAEQLNRSTPAGTPQIPSRATLDDQSTVDIAEQGRSTCNSASFVAQGRSPDVG